MIKINSTHALTLLQEVVDERGSDFTYEHLSKVVHSLNDDITGGCFYEYDGSPSCGVGAALHKAGVPVATLKALDEHPGDTGLRAVSKLLEESNVLLTSQALTILAKFQDEQDLGAYYGTALEAAQEAGK